MRKALVDSPGLIGAVARFWQRSYASDYVGLALLQTLYILLEIFVFPFHRMFHLDDISIQYPHALVERVSPTQNIIFAGIVPLVIIIVWAVLARPGFHTAHVAILGLFISTILTSFVTDIIKNAVGRPRPDLIARCKPKYGTPEHVLVTIDVCTETDVHRLQDGWRSFPSGHSSFAFAGLGYFALLLAGQMHVFRPRTDLTRALIALIPLLGAGYVAMSRTEDYRHDVYDVTCGSLLGMAIAYFSYRRYFRPLRHSKCHEPYPSHAEYAMASTGRAKQDEEHQRLNRDAEEFSLDDLTDDADDDVDVIDEHGRPLRKGRSRTSGGD